jgi:Na+-transporting NADH:ubiquinone oxidoreductase subunit NqrF
MKKSVLLVTIAMFLTIADVLAAVTIRYYNKDSKVHTMKVYMNGQTKEVKFSGSTTSSVTIQGSGTKCIIETPCGKVEVKDGDKVEIKNGCIKIN